MSKLGQIGARLYRGDVSIDFVGRRKTWYLMSLAIVVVAVAALLIRGLNYGIEFRGGEEFNAQIADPSSHVQQVTNAVTGTQIEAAANPVVVSSGQDAIRVQTKPLTFDQKTVIEGAIKKVGATEVNSTSIGPTWGRAIANKALLGLGVFVVLVVLFIWAYFREWRMSAAALVALAHDLLITIGVYALTGFEVTPATVTGLLTILGYSLYDTVVVFDKVRENTKGVAASTRRTYAQGANLAVNQTLVRSINTSIAALLPVGAILYVGAFQLGSGPLKDLALALFVGMAAGAYSSIFIATPLLAQLKMREPAMQAQARRVAARRAATERDSTRAAAAQPAAPASPQPTAPAAPPPAAPAAAAGATVAVQSPAPVQPPAPSGATAVTKTAPRPVTTAAAKRVQPQRRARSKRGKSK